MNQINVVTIGKLIEAHREGDEQKFKTYVDFIVKAYEERENDRVARIQAYPSYILLRCASRVSENIAGMVQYVRRYDQTRNQKRHGHCQRV